MMLPCFYQTAKSTESENYGDLPSKDLLESCATANSAAASSSKKAMDHMPGLITFDEPANRHDPVFNTYNNTAFLIFRPSPKNDCPGSIHRLPIPPELHDRHILSSIGPWLVVASCNRDQLHLLDPLSWARIPLPPPPDEGRFDRVVANRDITTAVALQWPPGRSWLSYTRLGGGGGGSEPEGTWIRIPGWRLYSDVAPHPDNGSVFYALQGEGCEVVESIKMVGNDDNNNSAAPFDVTRTDLTFNLQDLISDEKQKPNHEYREDARILVSGPSLYVVRFILWQKGDMKTKSIYIYMLSLEGEGDENKRQWIKVDSIGNSSFFLGTNQSISLTTDEYPDLRPNCVYLPLLHCLSDLHVADDPQSCLDYGHESLEDEDDAEDYTKDFFLNCIYNLGSQCWERFHGWDEESYRKFGNLDTTWIMPSVDTQMKNV